jgi:purine-binding chemotaxis protein CheW
MRRASIRAGPGIDWAALRRRLAGTADGMAAAGELDEGAERALLVRRAERLARPPPSSLETGGALQVVTFSLGRERYGIESAYVREVVRFTDFTPVPGAPEFLVGVTGLRGELLAIVDLRALLGVQQQGITDLSRIIVLGGERAEFGLLADSTHELKLLPAGQLLEPAAAAGLERQLLRGVTAEALIVLDGAALLRDQRLFIGADGGGAATEPTR